MSGHMGEEAGQWMSPRSVAEQLGVHPELVRRAVRRGELVGIRVGRRSIRLRAGDVAAWIARMAVVGAGDDSFRKGNETETT